MAPALLFVLFCVALAAGVAGAVAFGLRREVPEEELSGVRRQLGEVGRHLNGDAEAPERFVQLVTKR